MSRRSSSGNNDEMSSKAPIIYDESIDVPDAEEVRSPPSTASRRQPLSPDLAAASTSNHRSHAARASNLNDDNAEPCDMCQQESGAVRAEGESQESSSEEDEEDSEEDGHATVLEGAYDPAEFDHLPVSAEVKELFGHITRYTPQSVDLEFRLKPFVPDFIPAVGDIDAFLKVPRPDEVEDGAGLIFLDEPSGKQSDPAVLDLQLRALAKQSSAKLAVVKRVEHAERHSRAVDKWIRDISDLHRSRPPPAVHYTRPMPEIDSLMQEWPNDVEQQLQQLGVPPADLDCDLATYVDIVCGLFDIPVFESRIQSLHVLFSLYAAVKNSRYNPAGLENRFN